MSTTLTSLDALLAPNREPSRGLVHAWAMERPSLIAAGLRPGATVVELGCGDGTWTRKLAEEVGPDGAVFAFDADEALVDAARRAGGPALYETGSAYDTGLPDASVDLVVARHLFAHLGDPGRALAEIARILKPGGAVCLLEAHDTMLWLHPEPPGHADFVSRARALQALRGGDRDAALRLPGLLQAAGYADVRSEVQLLDTALLAVDAFVDLALAPLADLFVGDDEAFAADHVATCAARLDAGDAHGTAGFVATWALRA